VRAAFLLLAAAGPQAAKSRRKRLPPYGLGVAREIRGEVDFMETNPDSSLCANEQYFVQAHDDAPESFHREDGMDV